MMDDFHLLDNEDSKQQPRLEVIDEQKEAISGLFYMGVFVLFIIGLAVKMYQTWPSSEDIQRRDINNRRVELLNLLQNTTDEQAAESAAMEYDSLSSIINAMETEN